MTKGPPLSSGGGGREERFQALVESFLSQFRRGERPAIEEYAEKDPELAERIREYFPMLLVLERMRQPTEGVSAGVAAGAMAEAAGVSGARLGEFRLLREVGRGGMGIVYEAEQESLRRHVAIKVLPFLSSSDQRLIERFEREARAAARLQHPNIVPVYGMGAQEGTHFYAMQYVEGQSLRDVLPEVRKVRTPGIAGESNGEGSGRNPLSTSIALGLVSGHFEGGEMAREASDGQTSSFRIRAAPDGGPPESAQGGVAMAPSGDEYFHSVARVGRQVADALSYSHGQGILHRDIKPSNLLIDRRGWTWVVDFGLAKAVDLADLTRSGEIVGTLRYMAPERFQGIADARGDVYSLGVTLYELVTLRAPFGEVDRGELMRMVQEEEPAQPHEIDRSVPQALEAIVCKAMAKGAERRYQTASELAEDLDRFLHGRPVQARLLPARRPSARIRKWALLLVVVAISLASVLLWMTRERSPGPTVFPVGEVPLHLVIADFDRDNRLDIATANGLSNDVTVLLNRGGGSFESAGSFAVGKMPKAAAAADLDGDGDIDLATADQGSNDITLLLNEGTATFSAGQAISLPDKVFFVIAGDLDDDGDIDLAATGGQKFVWMLRNDGAGRFAAPVAYEAAPFPNALVSADLDGDRDMDLVAASSNGEASFISVLRNEGGGTFASAEHPAGPPRTFHIVASDLDGDGDIDLAGTGLTPQGMVMQEIWILKNRGDATFEPVEAFSFGSDVEALAAADLDGDGDHDLALVGGMSDLFLLRNDGQGRFVKVATLGSGMGPTFLAAADLDGDGLLDLAIANARANAVTVIPAVKDALLGQ